MTYTDEAIEAAVSEYELCAAMDEHNRVRRALTAADAAMEAVGWVRVPVDRVTISRAMDAVWPGWQSDDEKGEQYAFMEKALNAAMIAARPKG